MRGKFLRKCLPYIFLAPTFITLVIFLYLSVGVAFGISLTDKNEVYRTQAKTLCQLLYEATGSMPAFPTIDDQAAG